MHATSAQNFLPTGSYVNTYRLNYIKYNFPRFIHVGVIFGHPVD